MDKPKSKPAVTTTTRGATLRYWRGYEAPKGTPADRVLADFRKAIRRTI